MRGDLGVPIRLRYRKRGRVRFISHRDVARAFERAFRVERLPLAFTGGFSPRPKVSFGLALPVGHESEAEYLDLELTDDVELDAVATGLTAALPEGIDVTGASWLVERAVSLQEAVTATGWEVDVHGATAATIGDGISRVLAADRVEGVRRGKGVDHVDDLRPAILHLAVSAPVEQGVRVEVELATRPVGVRPAEVIAVLGSGFTEDPTVGMVLRTHQWIERDGARQEPLDADTRPRAREACAS